MNTRIVQEVEFLLEDDEYYYKDVKFELEGSYGNLGIGSYEYWGMRGNDVQMGWELDDCSWDKSLYTEKENEIIEKYAEKNSDYFCEMLSNFQG